MNRRGFLFRAPAFLAAPAIVRMASLMPVSVLPMPVQSVWGVSPAMQALPDQRIFNEEFLKYYTSLIEKFLHPPVILHDDGRIEQAFIDLNSFGRAEVHFVG